MLKINKTIDCVIYFLQPFKIKSRVSFFSPKKKKANGIIIYVT